MRQDARSRGVIHLHTSFSFDGSLSPARIAALCRDRGLSFAAIADHAESMDEDSMRRLAGECEEASGEDFVMIPGLEHRFRRGIHILAFGQRRLVPARNLAEMFEEIHADGCVLVAAHCTSAGDLPRELVEILTAVEIWNVGRDTRVLPTSRQIPVYRRLAKAYPWLYATSGLDMHKGNEWACETVLDPPCEASDTEVLDRLRQGQFATESRWYSFSSRPAGGYRELAFVAGDVVYGIREVRNRLHSRRKRRGSEGNVQE